jgi:hypothetical protein
LVVGGRPPSPGYSSGRLNARLRERGGAGRWRGREEGGGGGKGVGQRGRASRRGQHADVLPA